MNPFGINPDGFSRVEQALAALADALRGQYEAIGRATVDAFVDGFGSTPPLTERARAYQHARMVAALTCPWAPPRPQSEIDMWMASIVQEGAADA